MQQHGLSALDFGFKKQKAAHVLLKYRPAEKQRFIVCASARDAQRVVLEPVLLFTFPERKHDFLLFKVKRQIDVTEVVSRDDAHEFITVGPGVVVAEFAAERDKIGLAAAVSRENSGDLSDNAPYIFRRAAVRILSKGFQSRLHALPVGKCKASHGVFIVFIGVDGSHVDVL